MVGATLFLVILLGYFLLSGYILVLLTKMKKLEHPRFGTSVLILAATALTALVGYILLGSIPGMAVFGGFLSIALAGVPFSLLFKKTYRTTWMTSLDAYVNQLLGSVVLAILLNLFLQGTIYQTFTVENDSMNPLVLRGDFLLIDKHDRTFNREDIVLVHNPRYPQQLLLERIIALPSDTVSLDKDKLILNGKWKHERYSTTSFNAVASSTYITPDAYYLLNDNRTNELDSRVFGPVLQDQIVGKAFFLLRGPHFEFLP